jgi:hypothetical protein
VGQSVLDEPLALFGSEGSIERLPPELQNACLQKV